MAARGMDAMQCAREKLSGLRIVNFAGHYFGFNCSVVFAENYIEAAPASGPVAPVFPHPAS